MNLTLLVNAAILIVSLSLLLSSNLYWQTSVTELWSLWLAVLASAAAGASDYFRD